MANNNVANLIRQEMAKLEKQHTALSDALRVISELDGSKSSLPARLGSLQGLGESTRKRRSGNEEKLAKPGKKKAGKGKVGRPKGSKGKSSGSSKSAGAGASKGKTPAKNKKSAGSKNSRRPRRGINLNGAIRDYIEKANRFVSSSELADKFASYYPEKSKADFAKYISVLLSIAKSNKKLGATNLDKSGNEQRASYWGLTNWFSDGKGKSEFYK